MRASALLFVLAGCTPAETVDRAVVEGELLAVRVEVDAGSVNVRGGGEAVHIVRTLRGVADQAVSQRVEDGILRIEARCASLLPCAADIDLVVPPGLPVDVRTGDGNVYVAGLDGDLAVEVGDGDVRADGLLGATVRVQAGWGDARLSFAAAPTEVSVGVGVGDVRLTVPDGAYNVDVTALGERRIAVPADPTGPRLRVRTASGSAVVERG